MIGLLVFSLLCVTDLPAAYLETYEFLAIGKVSFYIYIDISSISTGCPKVRVSAPVGFS